MPPLPSTPFPTVLFHKQFRTVGLARARALPTHILVHVPRAAHPSFLPSPFAPPEPPRELRFAVAAAAAAAAAGRQGAQRATAPRPSSSILVEGSFWQEFQPKVARLCRKEVKLELDDYLDFLLLFHLISVC